MVCPMFLYLSYNGDWEATNISCIWIMWDNNLSGIITFNFIWIQEHCSCCDILMTITTILMYIYSNCYNHASLRVMVSQSMESQPNFSLAWTMVSQSIRMESQPNCRHQVELQSQYLAYPFIFKNICNYYVHLNLRKSTSTVAITALNTILQILCSFYLSQFIPGFCPRQRCAVALLNFLVALGGMTGLVAIVVVFSVTG